MPRLVFLFVLVSFLVSLPIYSTDILTEKDLPELIEILENYLKISENLTNSIENQEKLTEEQEKVLQMKEKILKDCNKTINNLSQSFRDLKNELRIKNIIEVSSTTISITAAIILFILSLNEGE